MSEHHKSVFVPLATQHKVPEGTSWCRESIDTNCVHLLKTINRFYRGFNVSTAEPCDAARTPANRKKPARPVRYWIERTNPIWQEHQSVVMVVVANA